MILKASQRGGGQDLAAHLMRMDENEHVEVHELRGFAAEDVRGAFKEAHGASLGTKCRQYLFSLSLSPPASERVEVAKFESAIERIEERLGLTDQPRAIVFHEKEGRRHAHCVWSRIDAESMTARQLSHFKNKLTDISRDLYLENGWEMPRGLMDGATRDPTNFTRAEWEQAKRLGQDPRWAKQIVQSCWKASDNAQSFKAALEERGMYLARGDKRGHVVVDSFGSVHSLSRASVVKAKDIRARLGDSATLASVDQVQQGIGERQTPAVTKHIEANRKAFEERARPLRIQKQHLAETHREARRSLETQQRAEQEKAAQEAKARLPRGLRGLWERVTGRYQQLCRENKVACELSRKRHDDEKNALVQKQLEERRALQAQITAMRSRQAERMLELRKDLSQFLRFSRTSNQVQPSKPARERQRDLDR